MAEEHRGAHIDPSASVEPGASIGVGTRVWSNVQVRSGATVGAGCVFGRNSFVDVGVIVGDNVKVQNNASLYEGVVIADGVFVGPHVIFTNDRVPRAVNPDLTLKAASDWEVGKTFVDVGAALGAGVVVVTGVTVGKWAMVGSGSVVTRDVPDYALVLGNPARRVAWISAAGVRCDTQENARWLTEREQQDDHG